MKIIEPTEGMPVTIQGTQYIVVMKHLATHDYWLVKAEDGTQFWTSGSAFEFSHSEMAKMGHFRGGTTE